MWKTSVCSHAPEWKAHLALWGPEGFLCIFIVCQMLRRILSIPTEGNPESILAFSSQAGCKTHDSKYTTHNASTSASLFVF